MRRPKQKQVPTAIGIAVILAIALGVLGYRWQYIRNYSENTHRATGIAGCEQMAKQLRQRAVDGQPISHDSTFEQLVPGWGTDGVLQEGRFTIEVAGEAPNFEGTTIRFETVSARSSVLLTVANLDNGVWTVEATPEILWWEVWR